MILHVLRVAGVVALVGAGVVFGMWVTGWLHEEPPPSFASVPSAVELFAREDNAPQEVQSSPPLVAQAEQLAAYLDPPQPPQAKPGHAVAKPVNPRVPLPVIPPTVTPRFKVHATSYCSDEPERSMVLISESGGQDGPRRWAKEGMQIGHFVIQEIRKGSIVCREANGERVHEMAVEHENPRNLLVRSQTGLAQASGQDGESIFDVFLNADEVQR